MTRKQTPLAAFTFLLCAGTVFGQNMNTLTPQEQAQGWQLLFDGKALKGWHSSAPVQGRGRAGAPQPAQPAQVGSSPKPCAAARGGSASAVPARRSQLEGGGGLLGACGAAL